MAFRVVAAIGALFGALALCGLAAAEERVRLEEVAVAIDRDAYVDWNRRDTALYAIQDEIIRDIFRTAAIEGAAGLAGARPAILSINVTYFDILSDLERLFCCARNEVTAEYQLLDALTGAPLGEAEALSFDHVGRGGFLLLLYPQPEERQLGRLFRLIADGTRDWLAGRG